MKNIDNSLLIFFHNMDRIEYFNNDTLDIILYIVDYLDDYDKVKFLSLNKFLRGLVGSVVFTKQYNIEKIKHLPFFDNFSSVIENYVRIGTRLPKKAKKVILSFCVYIPDGVLKQIVPDGTEHLGIELCSIINFTNCIPNSIKYLKIIDLRCWYVPLRYLRTKYVDLNINFDNFPEGIEKIILEEFCTQEFKGNFPKSLRYLSFNNYFPQNMDEINWGNINTIHGGPYQLCTGGEYVLCSYGDVRGPFNELHIDGYNRKIVQNKNTVNIFFYKKN